MDCTPLIHIIRSFILILCALFCQGLAVAGEQLILQLKDFTRVEMKSGGFTLPSDSRIRIIALGGSAEKKGISFSDASMYAYGWIINAETREPVWEMDRHNTRRTDDDRKFDGDLFLHKGSYEVYFSAHAFVSQSMFSNFHFNIDRREHNLSEQKKKKRWFFSWFEDWFGEDFDKEWKRRAKQWGVEVFAIENNSGATTFAPPREFSDAFFKAVPMGENEHVRQPFVLTKPMPIRIYALGEKDHQDELADYGWVVDTKTRKRVWEMKHSNLRPAGGDAKNVKFDGVIALAAGEYLLYYNTDDSHSSLDWNTAPPYDPLNYGITLIASEPNTKPNFKLESLKEEQNVIVQMTRIGDDETRNASFGLKQESQLRVYALGERGHSRHRLADYGWIINAKTREKVWVMDIDRTEHAGGAEKNRMIDEIITLPKGTYTVFYQTDDSHSYGDWNVSPPFDPEHWGITIYGASSGFSAENIEKNVTAQGSGAIAQIVQVGDHANRVQRFSLDKLTRVRIYALGEGQNKEMFDYGWIQNSSTDGIIWEMTYSMTFHAGGGRKNRMVNTTVLLDKGEYELHYVSDDSHSFNHWNTDPPDDPTMWGITLYEEK